MAARLLIVDDHAGFRAVARAMLEAAGFEVIAEASGAADAIQLASAYQPDVVLLDIALPDGDGFEVCDRLHQQGDSPAVILTSSRGADEYADRLATTTARGFIPKSQLTGGVVAELAG